MKKFKKILFNSLNFILGLIINPVLWVVIIFIALYAGFLYETYQFEEIVVNFSNCEFLYSLFDLLVPLISSLFKLKESKYYGLSYNEFRKLSNSGCCDLIILGVFYFGLTLSLMVFIAFGATITMSFAIGISIGVAICFFAGPFPVLLNRKTRINKIVFSSLQIWTYCQHKNGKFGYYCKPDSIEFKLMTNLLLSKDSDFYIDRVLHLLKKRKKVSQEDVLTSLLVVQQYYFSSFNNSVIRSSDNENLVFNEIDVKDALYKALSNIKILINAKNMYDVKYNNKIYYYTEKLLESCLEAISNMSFEDEFDESIYSTVSELFNNVVSHNNMSNYLLTHLLVWDSGHKKTYLIKHSNRYVNENRMSVKKANYFLYIYLYYDILEKENLNYLNNDDLNKKNSIENVLNSFEKSAFENNMDTFIKIHKDVSEIVNGLLSPLVFNVSKYDETYLYQWWKNNVLSAF